MAEINKNYLQLGIAVVQKNKADVEKTLETVKKITHGITRIYKDEIPSIEIPSIIDIYESVYKFPAVTQYLAKEGGDQLCKAIFDNKSEDDVRKKKVIAALKFVANTDSTYFKTVIEGFGKKHYSTYTPSGNEQGDSDTQFTVDSFNSKYKQNLLQPHIESLLNYGTPAVVAAVLNDKDTIFPDKINALLYSDIGQYFNNYLNKDQIERLIALFRNDTTKAAINIYSQKVKDSNAKKTQLETAKAQEALTVKQEAEERQRQVNIRREEERKLAVEKAKQERIQGLPAKIQAEVENRVAAMNSYISNEYKNAESPDTPATYECMPKTSTTSASALALASNVGGKRRLKRRKTAKRGPSKTGPSKTGPSKTGPSKTGPSKTGTRKRGGGKGFFNYLFNRKIKTQKKHPH